MEFALLGLGIVGFYTVVVPILLFTARARVTRLESALQEQKATVSSLRDRLERLAARKVEAEPAPSVSSVPASTPGPPVEARPIVTPRPVTPPPPVPPWEQRPVPAQASRETPTPPPAPTAEAPPPPAAPPAIGAQPAGASGADVVAPPPTRPTPAISSDAAVDRSRTRAAARTAASSFSASAQANGFCSAAYASTSATIRWWNELGQSRLVQLGERRRRQALLGYRGRGIAPRRGVLPALLARPRLPAAARPRGHWRHRRRGAAGCVRDEGRESLSRDGQRARRVGRRDSVLDVLRRACALAPDPGSDHVRAPHRGHGSRRAALRPARVAVHRRAGTARRICRARAPLDGTEQSDRALRLSAALERGLVVGRLHATLAGDHRADAGLHHALPVGLGAEVPHGREPAARSRDLSDLPGSERLRSRHWRATSPGG